MSNLGFSNRRPRAVKKQPIIERNVRKSKSDAEKSLIHASKGPLKRPASQSPNSEVPSKFRKQSNTDINSNTIDKESKTVSNANQKTRKHISINKKTIGENKGSILVSNDKTKSKHPSKTQSEKCKPKDIPTKKTQKTIKTQSEKSKPKNIPTKKTPKTIKTQSGKNKPKDPYSAYDFTSSDEEEPVSNKSKSTFKKNCKEVLSSPPLIAQSNVSVTRRVFPLKSPVVASYTFFTKGVGSPNSTIDSSLTAGALAAKRKESIATERRQCAEATFLLPLPNTNPLPASSGSIENFMKLSENEPEAETDTVPLVITNGTEESNKVRDSTPFKIVSSTPYTNKKGVGLSSKINLLKSLEEEADLELSKVSHSATDIELFGDDNYGGDTINNLSHSRSSHGKSSKHSKSNDNSEYENLATDLMAKISESGNHELKVVSEDE